MSDDTTLTAQNLPIKVRPIKRGEPGFLPEYRALLATKRAFTDFEKALPEDVDGAMALLAKYIIEPASQAEKMRVLSLVSEEEVTRLFDVILGRNIVPPAKDAA